MLNFSIESDPFDPDLPSTAVSNKQTHAVHAVLDNHFNDMMFEDTDSQDFQEERPPSPRDDDLYDLLGINRDASLEEIKTAYRTRSRMFHSDKHSNQEKRNFIKPLTHKRNSMSFLV